MRAQVPLNTQLMIGAREALAKLNLARLCLGVRVTVCGFLLRTETAAI